MTIIMNRKHFRLHWDFEDGTTGQAIYTNKTDAKEYLKRKLKMPSVVNAWIEEIPQ